MKDKPDDWPAAGFKAPWRGEADTRFKRMQSEISPIGIAPAPKGFDFDGVIYLGDRGVGVRPGPKDVIITGRSWEEAWFVNDFLSRNQIAAPVFFNPLPYLSKSRETSGIHKANVIKALAQSGVSLLVFFEDDPVQIEQIKKVHPLLHIVHLQHELTEK